MFGVAAPAIRTFSAHAPGGRLLVFCLKTGSVQQPAITAPAFLQPDQSPCSTPEQASGYSEPCSVSGLLSAIFRCSRIAWTNSARASCRSRSALRTPSLTILPSGSIVFRAGGGSSIPQTSSITHLISARFSHALFREAWEARNWVDYIVLKIYVILYAKRRTREGDR
jgi:hypothetical protein